MKKIALFSMALLLTGALGIVLLSSFKGGSVEEKDYTDKTYFQFIEDEATEANLENVNSWDMLVSRPGTNPCDIGTDAPCVIHVSNSAAGISTSDTEPQKIQKLVNYLAAQSSAESFVADPSVFDYQKP
jgi:hypothetical protein